MPELTVPQLSLVVLVGASGSGKSTFAARHFAPTEVVSSDECRGMVADDPNDQAATGDAFALLHTLVGLRLKRGLLTVALVGGDGGAIAAGGLADHVVVARSTDPRVVKEVHVTAYHVLWELVHVFFEHPGAL